MYLYGTVPTACLTVITCTLNHLATSQPKSLAIPYSGLLLIMMIPLAVCQPNGSYAASTITSTADSMRDSATNSTLTITTPSTSNSSDSNSCSSSNVCARVFADGNNEVTVSDGNYLELQCNYTFFLAIMDRKNDCVDEATLTLEPTTCSRNVTCLACLNYYQQWLCSTANNYSRNGTSYPPCQSILCDRVKRACPYIHPVDNETIYSSEPGFLCNGKPDNLPCYYFSTSSKRDNYFLRPYNSVCGSDNGSSVCILESQRASTSTLSASNVTVVLTALLTLLCTSYS